MHIYLEKLEPLLFPLRTDLIQCFVKVFYCQFFRPPPLFKPSEQAHVEVLDKVAQVGVICVLTESLWISQCVHSCFGECERRNHKWEFLDRIGA